MGSLKIISLRNDYVRMRASDFAGNLPLAQRAREAFIHTPGVESFEVSPLYGDVVLCFDRRCLLVEAQGRALRELLEIYFPELSPDSLLARDTINWH